MYIGREYGSAYDGNIDYYIDHPEKYSPQKIQKEVWLPQRVRTRMNIALFEVTGYAERKKMARHKFRAQVSERKTTLSGEPMQKVIKPGKRFKFTLDKLKRSHKVDAKTGRYVPLNKAERERRFRARKTGIVR